MKQVVAAAAAAAICAVLSSGALAGVVISETETTISGAPQKSSERTLMIEGNREKMITQQYQVITDLDKGVMYMINPADKSYSEMPFPGPMAHTGGSGMRPAEFKATGKSRTVAGYKCEDYQGQGKFMMGDFDVTSCISKSAPGAKEFAAFEKGMEQKLKGTSIAMPSNIPDGVPLAQETTTKMGDINIPNMPPEAAAKLKEQYANRPPVVSKTEVTKIAEQKLPDDTFTVPSGYTKREHGMGMGQPGATGGGNPHGGGAGAPGAGPGGAGGSGAPNPHSGE